eukprot:m51a1_g1038 putative C-tail anchored protein (303) ;mRNA; f:696732-698494
MSTPYPPALLVCREEGREVVFESARERDAQQEGMAACRADARAHLASLTPPMPHSVVFTLDSSADDGYYYEVLRKNGALLVAVCAWRVQKREAHLFLHIAERELSALGGVSRENPQLHTPSFAQTFEEKVEGARIRARLTLERFGSEGSGAPQAPTDGPPDRKAGANQSDLEGLSVQQEERLQSCLEQLKDLRESLERIQPLSRVPPPTQAALLTRAAPLHRRAKSRDLEADRRRFRQPLPVQLALQNAALELPQPLDGRKMVLLAVWGVCGTVLAAVLLTHLPTVLLLLSLLLLGAVVYAR